MPLRHRRLAPLKHRRLAPPQFEGIARLPRFSSGLVDPEKLPGAQCPTHPTVARASARRGMDPDAAYIGEEESRQMTARDDGRGRERPGFGVAPSGSPSKQERAQEIKDAVK